MSSTALEGIRVLERTRVYARPCCTTLLADLGAEGIHVGILGGKPGRNKPPGLEIGREGPHDRSRDGYFPGLNCNKDCTGIESPACLFLMQSRSGADADGFDFVVRGHLAFPFRKGYK